MNKTILISGILWLFLLCSFSGNPKDNSKELTDSITSSYSRHLQKTKNLILCGSGGTSISDVQMINLEYDSSQELNLEETRLLFIDCVEGLLKIVNQDKQLRKYLHDYPFTCKNLMFGIGFITADNKWSGNNKIAYVSVIKEKIFYRTADSKDRLQYHFEEPYKEALRIVRETKAKSSILQATAHGSLPCNPIRK